MLTGTIERDTQHKHQPWVILSQQLNESPVLSASPAKSEQPSLVPNAIGLTTVRSQLSRQQFWRGLWSDPCWSYPS